MNISTLSLAAAQKRQKRGHKNGKNGVRAQFSLILLFIAFWRCGGQIDSQAAAGS
jgi:hypothetical protein